MSILRDLGTFVVVDLAFLPKKFDSAGVAWVFQTVAGVAGVLLLVCKVRL
jgi:hypothetical protein